MTTADVIYLLLLLYVLVCVFGEFLVEKYMSKNRRIQFLICVGISGAALNALLGGIRQTIVWELMTLYWVWRYYRENWPSKNNKKFDNMESNKKNFPWDKWW